MLNLEQEKLQNLFHLVFRFKQQDFNRKNTWQIPKSARCGSKLEISSFELLKKNSVNKEDIQLGLLSGLLLHILNSQILNVERVFIICNIPLCWFNINGIYLRS